MATNRLHLYLEREPDPAPPPDDYWVIGGDCGWYYVPAAEADRVARTVARLWSPGWVSFTDISGAVVRVLARDINCIFESTINQRSAERSFRRARKEEDKADRAWDEE